MSAYLPVFRNEGIAALGFIPLVTGGRLLGKFMVYFDRPHHVSAHDLEVVQAIANHLASVIVRFSVIAKLQETIQYNEMFAGVLAHDLRNPLSAIMSAAHMLLRRQDGDRDRITKPVNRILTSGERMTRMIDQLLDFTRVRVGRGVQIHPRPTTLADLCHHAVEELELIYPEWQVAQESRGDVTGVWDSEALLQVASNLISNAGQHGTRNAPILLTLDGTNRETVTLAVHNAGNIPEALLPRLFDPFRRAALSRIKSSGLGLGLFIVREIVRAHGGTVDVVSSETSGTTFTIRLPRHAKPRGGRLREMPPNPVRDELRE
jgi:signal transduction histidine kinase